MRLKESLALVQPFLCGFLGAAIFIGIYQLVHPAPQIGSVNVNRLVRDHIRDRVHSSLSQAALQADSQRFMMKLERVLQEVALTHHLYLIVSEAVIAGPKDYTEQVRQQLEKKQ